ncbi:MAG: hypothetical protein PF694_05890 [Bacteroidetes bacterium]|jgi:hypothetical protein|nr:hypothetical protein [Bacteroidota bacterium]
MDKKRNPLMDSIKGKTWVRRIVGIGSSFSFSLPTIVVPAPKRENKESKIYDKKSSKYESTT